MVWWKRTLNDDFPVRSARKLIGFSKCVPFDPFCTPCFQMKRSLCAPTFNEETFIFVSKFLLRVISFFLPKLLRSFFAIRLLVLFCPAPVCLWQLRGKHLLTITMMKTQVYDRYLKKTLPKAKRTHGVKSLNFISLGQTSTWFYEFIDFL